MGIIVHIVINIVVNLAIYLLLKSIIMKEVILCSFAVVLAAGAYLLTADKTSEGALLLSNVEALTRA